MPFSVFTSETASRPAPSAAAATAAGSLAFGVSFTISGLRPGDGRARPRASGLLGVGAHDQARLDVGAGHVQLDQVHLVALAAPPQAWPAPPG